MIDAEALARLRALYSAMQESYTWENERDFDAALMEAFPALLDIAEAVARAPAGHIDIGRNDSDAEDSIEFLPDDGPESTAWAMGYRHVRIVPCTGGGE